MSEPAKRILPLVSGTWPISVFKQRRLAHAVVAEHADHLVLADREVDPGQNRNAAVAGVEIVDFKHQAATCLPR